MDYHQLQKFINTQWEQSIVPTLQEYIRIPNKSPAYDAKWQEHGYMEQAVNLLVQWVSRQGVKNLSLEVVKLPGRTPLIWIEMDGQINKSVLMYGHLDKQPEMEGWDQDKNPWQPVLIENKLYGRGGADDGYSIFAAVTAIKALQIQNLPHPRCVIIIEACEESGSYDLPHYIDHLQKKIGVPDLIVCLDSGCLNYEQLWCTTSLRGIAAGTLTVEVMKEGLHSGVASGVVPSSFRILRQLLSRVENEAAGEILLKELYVDIPSNRTAEAKKSAEVLGTNFLAEFPLVDKMRPVTEDLSELILNRTWRPTLSITGIGGIPSIDNAGNVLRPRTQAKLSFRLPPTCDEIAASRKIKATLEANPPYGAKVTYQMEAPGEGWNAPPTADWLLKTIHEASNLFYNKPAQFFGEGGTIPFMGMLGKKFPQAQFLIVGVLGPKSNAHGPNEFLHIPMAKKLTACVSYVISQIV